MHLSILFCTVAVAVVIRLGWSKSTQTWAIRWQHALTAFLLPPLLLLTSSITVLVMGHHGTMLGLPVGWLSCLIGLAFLSFAVGLLCYQSWQTWRSLHQVRTCPRTTIAGKAGRVLESSAWFAAQVGFLQPELVVSQGLLQALTPAQLEAVLNHEQAHQQYGDTFWFFWWGWLRRLTLWLPKTESLWQELLLLREIRADHWAAQSVDPLLLAETLLLVVRSHSVNATFSSAAFNDIASATRLEERIEFLVTQTTLDAEQWQRWGWLLPMLLPTLTLPFHI
jgi:Zn-dependent protease with chaperone function